MPCPALQLLTAMCRDKRQSALRHLACLPTATDVKCQRTCAPVHPTGFVAQAATPVATSAYMLDGSLSCSAWAGGQHASWEIGAWWRPPARWFYLLQEAKYPPSKSSLIAPQEQCKGYSFWHHFWQQWGEMRERQGWDEHVSKERHGGVSDIS